MSLLSPASSSAFPGELIILISRLFASPLDVISFGLVSKRFYALILSKIKDENDAQSRQLLKLHTHKIIGWHQISHSEETVYCYYDVLPNGQQFKNGTEMLWNLWEYEEGYFTIEEIQQDEAERRSGKWPWEHYSHITCYTGYITRPEDVAITVAILEKWGRK